MNYGIDRSVADTFTDAAKAAGGADKLAAAVQSGEVQEVVHNGVTYYKKSQLEAGKESKSGTVTKIGGRQAITREMADEASKAIKDLKWDFIPSKDMKMLQNGNLPESVKEKVSKAVKANDKCVSDAQKMLGVISKCSAEGCADRNKTLKEKFAFAMDTAAPLEKILKLNDTDTKNGEELAQMIGTLIVASKRLRDEVVMAKSFLQQQRKTWDDSASIMRYGLEDGMRLGVAYLWLSAWMDRNLSV